MLTRFKPYYKWITFNTMQVYNYSFKGYAFSFKPYYKWITFNTIIGVQDKNKIKFGVLNLIINGLPSILDFKSI